MADLSDNVKLRRRVLYKVRNIITIILIHLQHPYFASKIQLSFWL